MKPGKTLRFKTLLPVLICALLALGVTSQTALALELGPTGLRLSGEVAQTASWFFDPGELVIGVTRYKLSLDQSLRRAGIGIDGHLHVSVKGWYDHEASEGKWIELGEAYADIYHDLFDLRLGHQVVSWGTAYGLNPTSYVNPMPALDTLEPGMLTDAAGLPVPAAYVSAYPSWRDLSADIGMVLVLDPRLQGVPLPKEAQAQILYGVRSRIKEGLDPSDLAGGLAEMILPWLPPGFTVTPEFLEGLAQIIINYAEARLAGEEFVPEVPGSFTDRLEFAARAGMNFGMWDLYLSGFRGWEDAPVLWVEVVPSVEFTEGTSLSGPSPPPIEMISGIYMDLYPKAAYRKATALGAAVSGTWGPYTFWGEASYTWPDEVKELDPEQNVVFSTNNPYLQLVIGADQMLGSAGEYYVMGQYIYNGRGSLLSPYTMPDEEGNLKVEPGHYLSAIGRATILDDHQIELINVLNIRDKSGLIMPRYTYKINPMLSTWVETTLLFGEESTEFGSLPMNKYVSCGVKVIW
jgi:hypothetical protein